MTKSLGERMVFTLFTNDGDLSETADKAGVDRVGLDLEVMGKRERQAGLNTWISDHQEEEIGTVATRLARSKLFIRTNPIHEDIREEIERYIEAGVECLMLPFFHTVDEAHLFTSIIDGRAEVSLLVETPASAFRLNELVKIEGVDEIHIGLNDLHLGIGLGTHFELLVSDVMPSLAETVRRSGIPFGFGGVARFNDSKLPISSDLIYAEYARLGATRALVSRAFTSHNVGDNGLDLAEEVKICRERIDYWSEQEEVILERAHLELRKEIQRFIESRNAS